MSEAAVVALALAAAWLAGAHPTLMPVWGPWDFSWPAFLGVGLVLVWFLRGLRTVRLPRARVWCFLVGLAAVYAMLLTKFDYLGQHMFFLNRIQHAVLHHFAPFLIALSWPGEVLAAGTPSVVRRWCERLGRPLRVLQQPVVATVLFEGLLALWLVPAVMFRAMFDWRLYWAMNASMVLDGLLFWFLVLDPRPCPEAPVGYFARATMAFVIIFPQIVLGTVIEMAQHDLYPSFALCGRVFPGIGALADQEIGSLILWVPAGMMSALATVVIMGRLFRHDAATWGGVGRLSRDTDVVVLPQLKERPG